MNEEKDIYRNALDAIIAAYKIVKEKEQKMDAARDELRAAQERLSEIKNKEIGKLMRNKDGHAVSLQAGQMLVYDGFGVRVSGYFHETPPESRGNQINIEPVEFI